MQQTNQQFREYFSRTIVWLYGSLQGAINSIYRGDDVVLCHDSVCSIEPTYFPRYDRLHLEDDLMIREKNGIKGKGHDLILYKNNNYEIIDRLPFMSTLSEFYWDEKHMLDNLGDDIVKKVDAAMIGLREHLTDLSHNIESIALEEIEDIKNSILRVENAAGTSIIFGYGQNI